MSDFDDDPTDVVIVDQLPDFAADEPTRPGIPPITNAEVLEASRERATTEMEPLSDGVPRRIGPPERTRPYRRPRSAGRVVVRVA